MNGIGWAVKEMQNGAKVKRAGWNSADQFLYFVPSGNYPARTEVAKKQWGDDALVPYQPYIAIKTVQETVVPWNASQSDLLATDWEVVE